MSSRYELQAHIQPLVVAPRTEGVFDQREITIQSYQTTVPFDYAKLDAGLGKAWLTPQIRFGVFARLDTKTADSLNVVLGLQDELTVRTYDYDERRPLWYSWQNVVVDTVNLRYFKDENGLLRITTTGGGQRITDDRLHEFNSGFLGIPQESVSKRQFDLGKLRDLCFNRFLERLYMLRFSDPSGKEYRSIDHALFQSRKYIDPEAERLLEVRSDTNATVESFESDTPVDTSDLAAEIRVRFTIRGLSGSLRLKFPKVVYRKPMTTPEEQVRVFYRLVDVTVSSILDDNYYTTQKTSLDDLRVNPCLHPDLMDLAPFREVLVIAEARRSFLLDIDLNAAWHKWLPPLRAIDELLQSDVIAEDVKDIVQELVRLAPTVAARLLSTCRGDAKTYGLGGIVASALASGLQALPPVVRAQAEEQILAWTIEREVDSWEIDVEKSEFGALGLRWRIDDIAFDHLPAVVWKLFGVIHAKLTTSSDDVGCLLCKYDWCVTVAKSLPSNHSRNPAAFRLIAENRIPKSVSEATRVLKRPVSSIDELDEAVLNQFGLPLWPLFSACRENGDVRLSNEGIGSALAVRIYAGNTNPRGGEHSAETVLGPGDTMSHPLTGDHAAVDVKFEKYGRAYSVKVPILGENTPTVALDNRRIIATAINRKRITTLQEYRQQIDPDQIVVGSSPGLLEVFEQIHYANLTDGPPAVLLLGEPGVGKTHIADLIHKSSSRALKPFEVVNAGSGGGDINLQRGEWIGYGKGHGLQHIDKKGHPGHLMRANGGTLFVDEIASFSIELQTIFLSVLERRAVQKVGGESLTSDVRCILATNADLEKAVAEGKFRRDLLDRIPVKIRIPPLRERKGDILLLARKFAGNRQILPRCLIALLRHEWPDNIRGMKLKMDLAIARMKSGKLTAIGLEHLDLPDEVISRVEDLDEDVCLRELWTLADKLAHDEGYEHGTGLQRRAGEIMGVRESQASKAYQTYGFSNAASA